MPQSHTTDQPMAPRGRVKKASSSLFPSEIIAKLERTQSTVKQNKQPIIVLYFESENELKFYNLDA